MDQLADPALGQTVAQIIQCSQSIVSVESTG